jgi:hypothetical protein
MFFLYVYTDASDNVGDGPFPITVSVFDRQACMAKRVDVIRSLVESEGIDWDSVTSVQVETEDDPDETDPETMLCYQKGGI